MPLNLVRHDVRKPWRHELEGKEFRFCPAPDCEVVYYAGDGPVFVTKEICRPPAYKTGAMSDLLCYCFDASAPYLGECPATVYAKRVSGNLRHAGVLVHTGSCFGDSAASSG